MNNIYYINFTKLMEIIEDNNANKNKIITFGPFSRNIYVNTIVYEFILNKIIKKYINKDDIINNILMELNSLEKFNMLFSDNLYNMRIQCTNFLINMIIQILINYFKIKNVNKVNIYTSYSNEYINNVLYYFNNNIFTTDHTKLSEHFLTIINNRKYCYDDHVNYYHNYIKTNGLVHDIFEQFLGIEFITKNDKLYIVNNQLIDDSMKQMLKYDFNDITKFFVELDYFSDKKHDWYLLSNKYFEYKNTIVKIIGGDIHEEKN